MRSYTGGEVSVCDSLSGGLPSDSLPWQLAELRSTSVRGGAHTRYVDLSGIDAASLRAYEPCP